LERPQCCAATDAAGNRGTNSFSIIIRDTSAPVIRVADQVVEATGPLGAQVSFMATASDAVDGSDNVYCSIISQVPTF
jgi:hypothetical protein